MAYVMTLLDCQWDAVADRIEAVRHPVDMGLVRNIRLVLDHQPQECSCEVAIDLNPEQAQRVQSVLPVTESAMLASIG